MLTLNNDPPTLDRERTTNKYTKTFKDLIDSCMNKDPTKRYENHTLCACRLIEICMCLDHQQKNYCYTHFLNKQRSLNGYLKTS